MLYTENPVKPLDILTVPGFCSKIEIINMRNYLFVSAKKQNKETRRETAMKCKKCGAEWVENAKFCVKCGGDAPTADSEYPRNCSVCGGVIEEGDIYCGYCGTKVEESPVPAKEKRSCPHCHLLLDHEETVCHNCGFDFNPAPAAPAVGVAASATGAQRELNAFDVVRGGIAAYAIGNGISDAITVHNVVSEAQKAIDGEPYNMDVIEDALAETIEEQEEGILDSIFDIFG